MNKMLKNRTMAITIAFILVSSMAISLIATVGAAYNTATQTAINQGMNFAGQDYNASTTRLLLWNRWQDKIPTFVYVVPSPDPVGVGQQVSFIMMNPQLPNAAGASNDIRYEYSLKIGKPDGTSETLPPTGAASGVYTQYVRNGRFVSDSTGTAYTIYTPEQVGTYMVTITFHELFYRWNSTTTERDYYGVTFKESTYTYNLTVQDEQVIPRGWSTVPLPTEYWSRPIEGQNTEWWRISSNWYNNARDRNNGGSENRYQPDGTAPNTGHILWTKTTEDGGLVGGGNFSVQGEVYNAGHQYQTRMDSNMMIMNGKLYYLGPRYWAGEGDIYRAVDLQTGQTIWERNITGIGAPSFGYLYDWDDMNQHGVVNPGWLFTNNFARAYHPLYGDLTALNITSVPSGFEAAGQKGEVLRYAIANAGNTTNPNWRLTQWNSSRVFISASSGNIPGNATITPAPSGTNTYWNGSMWVSNAVRTAQGYAAVTQPSYDWNVSLSVTFANSPTIRAATYGDVLLGSNGSHPIGSGSVTYNYPENVTLWAVSLKPGQEGRLLWMKTIQTAGFPDNHVVQFRKAAEGVFTMIELPYQRPVAYSMYTGELLWTADEAMAEYNPFGYYGYASLINVFYEKIAYGKYFVSGYSGMVFAYDLYNGTLLWRYEAPTGMTVFKYYTLMMGAVADGKLYIGTHEHSADTPLFKGNRVRALDVNTGKEVWTMYGWAYPGTFAVADGTLIYWNNYDHQIYAIAKGPSSTTVTASPKVSVNGNNVLVEGSVIDISAGTKQKEQAARFPNGVPAVSDASQSQWMEYVYMQKQRPMNTTGVDVFLSVLDPNGNPYSIGTATSDSSGTFGFTWQPPVPGQYTVYATFAGSNSYWPSFSETYITVAEAPAATAAPTPAPASIADAYFVPAIAGIIVAIAIVGALLALLLLKKRP